MTHELASDHFFKISPFFGSNRPIKFLFNCLDKFILIALIKDTYESFFVNLVNTINCKNDTNDDN